MRDGPQLRPEPDAGVPRLAAEVIGFRYWRLDGDALRPLLYSNPYRWHLGPNTAHCLCTPEDGHPFLPDPDCTCGLYAYHEPPPHPPYEAAMVSGAGRRSAP